MAADEGAPKIYVAINDLHVYASAISQPTGIQRVATGHATALIETGATTILLTPDGPRAVGLPGASVATAVDRGPARATLRETVLRLLARLPRPIQETARRAARTLLARRVERRGGAPVTLGPGDWILLLGAPWIAPGMAAAALRIRATTGARIGLLVHDLLPTTQPRWFADAQGRAAKLDVESLIRGASHLFAVSSEVQRELEARYGKSATLLTPAEPPMHARTSTTRGDYVLYVGTMHPRKNLEALVQIWLRWPGAPRLILAGRRHPQDGPLFQALAHARAAGARIDVRHDVDDTQLMDLYAGARFLVLPSLAEGWGLPVRESFAAGRPAIATDAVPAALGTPFADVVPAGDTAALESLIHRWWESDIPERRSQRIRREFTPRTWRDGADELLAALSSAAE